MFRKGILRKALNVADHVVVLTHVPPFVEAAWHRGAHSDPDWLPFFACKAAGDVLKNTMENHPHKRMTVLCGHTHGGGVSHILPNLVVYTGAARYGHPTIHRALEWG
jgi:3',5'-cyclic-AMP phosphodiesterase